MANSLPKLIVVLGQTASGKSDLAVRLAKEFNGEVVSADSRQVYRGLDIGSGKITPQETEGVPHYLLDVVEAGEKFSVADFQQLASTKIEEILTQKKLPIICGGTGFYLDSIIYNYELPQVSPNPLLREELKNKDLGELFATLKNLDQSFAQKLNLSEQKNKQRLIRYIEIAQQLGQIPPVKTTPKFDVLFLGIKWDKQKLETRIYQRLILRLDHGMIEEVQGLLDKNISPDWLFSLGLEYRYITQFLLEKKSREWLVETLNAKICQFAKRQNTWFKRNQNIIWLQPENLAESKNLVRKFIQ